MAHPQSGYGPAMGSETAGDEVQGWLATPPGDGPFPLYLKVHGGPSWLYPDTWWPDVQALLDEGFAVAMVNYRGSIGYGRAWRDHIIGNIGDYRSPPVYWWYDADAADNLAEAMKTGATLPPQPFDVRFDDVFHGAAR